MNPFRRAAAVAVVLATASWLALGRGFVNAASLFELGVSVRAIGMGDAFLAVADDDGAVFYNPAGLPQLGATAFSSMFTRPFGAYSYGALTAAQRGWGIQLLILDSDTLEKRDLYGNVIGSFRYTETGLILAGGVRAGAMVSVGLQAKLYALALPTQGTGVALSPAISFREGARTYAIVWRNALSTDLRFASGHREPWPRDIAVGIAWRAADTLYALDFTEHLITRGDVSCVRFGVEHVQFDPLVLRIGMNREGSSVGASVRWRGFRLDAAYVFHFNLPDSFYISLSTEWDEPLLEWIAAPLRWLGRLLFG
ncbi:MAG TPA: hypothetical protein ENN53_05065 [Candidatus Acetothermia bacterium]|nr:hypothetical protein [Candidatus Acetothermia bacterium]